MATPISSALDKLERSLATYSDRSVELGHPATLQADICIFPYRLEERPVAQNTPAVGILEPPGLSYSLHCLIIPSPREDYPIIDIVLEFLADTPFLDVPDYKAALSFEMLDIEASSQVFMGAKIEFCLSIPVEISITPAA